MTIDTALENVMALGGGDWNHGFFMTFHKKLGKAGSDRCE